MSPGRQLRDLIAKRRFLVTPGLTTPLHAMIVERAGFEIVYTGGYDVSLTLLGLPDVGLITATEMVANARNIARAVKVPVIADVDTGYGNALNVIRTVQDYESAGVAAIHIEDQVHPKKCGHVAGKQLISREEAVGKLRAAIDRKADKDFVIIGRTDAIAAAGGGLDEAIARGRAYADAGCDLVWAEFPSASLEQPRQFAQAMRQTHPELPLYFNYSANLNWAEHPASFEEIAALGFKVMHVSLCGMRTTMQAMWDYAVNLKQSGAQAEIEFQKQLSKHPMGKFHELARFPEFKALEEKYLPNEIFQARYEGAVGL